MRKNYSFYPWLFSLVSKALFLIALFWSNATYAQDPAQYGTPFNGVPDPQDASIYQVNMRCFSSTRNLQGVINRLDNIKNLGVKVIQLMPVQPVSTHSRAVNSPYSWKDWTSVGAEFGSLTTLRALVDGAHSRGMAVIMDWVANQTGWDHPWITQHPDWYVRVNGVIQSLNGWNDVAALDMNNATMRAAQITAMRYWIFAANIDGYRFDYANNAPSSFWTAVIPNLKGITSHKLIINAEGDGSAMYSAGFDYTFSWNFYNNMKAIRGGSSATLIDNSNTFDYNGATGGKQVVRWLTNHDMYGSEGSPYNLFGGKNGTLAAFVVAAYMKSVPFIYNGMEVGNTVAMPFPFNTSVINWTQDVSITPEMTKILAHRNFSTAIRRGTLTSYTNADVCVFKKVSGSETVFVMSNQRNAGKTITLPSGIANTTMYDAYTNAAVGLTANYYLAPYQWVVLKNGCNPTTIVPYIQVNAGAWQNTASASLAAGGSFKIGPQPTSGGSWRWTGPGGFTATTREISRTSVTTAMGGGYVATYTNTCGNTSTLTFNITISSTLSATGLPAVEMETGLAEFDIYPNPSNNRQLNIEIPSLSKDEVATVTINDLKGNKAMETTIGKSTKIDHQLPAGLYVIRVRAKGFNAVKKIVIE